VLSSTVSAVQGRKRSWIEPNLIIPESLLLSKIGIRIDAVPKGAVIQAGNTGAMERFRIALWKTWRIQRMLVHVVEN
jgi:hypothetical protein